MIYKQFKDKQLSWLGLGAMRLPTLDGGAIDEKKAFEVIQYAYDHGINYFDTGYFYLSGKCEGFVGKSLANFPRQTWNLAAKMPGNLIRRVDGKLEVGGFNLTAKAISGPADIFEGQLETCGVDYFDFYMLHNLSETTYGTYTDESLGIVEYLQQQKKAGRIRHLGFSAHGRAETIEKFLNLHDCFEFVMIQLNYLDWLLQEAGKKYELITKRGIPALSMEPLRGGKLANFNPKASAILKGASPASWAFRYLQSLANVPVVVSGMSNLDQLKENIALFEKDPGPMPEGDKALLQQAIQEMAETTPCTSCRYCIDACPKSLDIPKLLSMYNEASYEISWTLRGLTRSMKEDEMPGACIGCGDCNPLCPQDIDIPSALKAFGGLLAQ